MANLKPGQLVALQTLWTQYARHDLMAPNTREERLRWASQNLCRSITSFNDLSRDEAASLINTLQSALGREIKDKPYRRPRTRDAAQAAGTHGRRGQKTNVDAIASTADIARIDEALQRLGWDTKRFHAWLYSPSSPLGQTSNPKIRTVAQANKVWWALKGLLKRAGQWKSNSKGAQ